MVLYLHAKNQKNLVIQFKKRVALGESSAESYTDFFYPWLKQAKRLWTEYLKNFDCLYIKLYTDGISMSGSKE